MQTTSIQINGMTCAACARRVEKAIQKLEGVESVSVNFATEKATVSYNTKTIHIRAIQKAIEKIGYKTLRNKYEEIEDFRTKFIASAIFSLPLLYIAMAPMISFIRLPFPAWLEPMDFPLNYAFSELLLLVPIIRLVGYKFYTVGFKSLAQRSPNMDSLIAIGTSAAILFSLYRRIPSLPVFYICSAALC